MITGSENSHSSPQMLGTPHLCSIRQGPVGFLTARADPVHGEKLSFCVTHSLMYTLLISKLGKMIKLFSCIMDSVYPAVIKLSLVGDY